MSTTKAKVAGIISLSSSSSGGRHGDTASVKTDGMIYHMSGNSISRHGYLAGNAFSSHIYLTNITITARKLKTVYVGKIGTLYPSFS